MKIDKLRELNNIHLDALTEIGNIAASSAATSLAGLLNFRIDMSLPKVRIVDTTLASNLLGGPENVKVGILAKFRGDISGIIMFLIEEKFAKDILKTLIGAEFTLDMVLSEMEHSVISEIGNIMVAAYVNAISSMTDMYIDISVPSIAIDMVGALLAVPALELSPASDDIIFVEGVLLDENQAVSSNILLVPTMESLNTLLTRLGI